MTPERTSALPHAAGVAVVSAILRAPSPAAAARALLDGLHAAP
jgi:thiamine monophosphate synthase